MEILRFILFCTSLPWHHLPWPRWINDDYIHDQHDGNEILTGHPEEHPGSAVNSKRGTLAVVGVLKVLLSRPIFQPLLKVANEDTPGQPDMTPK